MAGLGFLSKGLVALLFPGGWTLALLLLCPRYRRGLRGLLNPLGPLLVIAGAAPWLCLMEKRHPGFFHFFFAEQHFQRYLTQRYNRMSPWYFYLLIIPATLLPWTPVVLAGLAGLARRWREETGTAALALWALMVACFFSASHSKLATYVLPAFPHFCLVGARALQEEAPAWAKRLSWGLGTVLLLAPAALFLRGRVPAGLIPPAAVIAAALLGAAVLGLALLTAGRKGGASASEATRLGLAGLAAGGLFLALLRLDDGFVSARAISRAIVAERRPEDLTYTYGTYLHGLPFYTGRRVEKLIYWTGELHYAKRDSANAERFGDDTDIMALPREGRRVFVVLRTFEAPHFLSLTTTEKLKSYRQFGPWVLAEF